MPDGHKVGHFWTVFGESHINVFLKLFTITINKNVCFDIK